MRQRLIPLRMNGPILQVALDVTELSRALQIAEESVAGGADWIEAGTPLIKSEGMQAVRALKEKFPDRTIVADMKVADTGTLEVEMAAKAGASVVGILADADDAVVEEAVRAARLYGVRLMADLINAPEPVKRAFDLERMGVDFIAAHTGIDQQMKGSTSLDLLRSLAGTISVPLAVAGGIDAGLAGQAVQAGAAIVIVGGNIVRSRDVAGSAAEIRRAMDSPRLEEERLRTGPVVTIYNRLARLEKRLYEQIPPPDIVLRLQMSLETAIRRNRERDGREGEDYMASRHRQSQDWHLSGARYACNIDTEGPIESTVCRVKETIWGLL